MLASIDLSASLKSFISFEMLFKSFDTDDVGRVLGISVVGPGFVVRRDRGEVGIRYRDGIET